MVQQRAAELQRLKDDPPGRGRGAAGLERPWRGNQSAVGRRGGGGDGGNSLACVHAAGRRGGGEIAARSLVVREGFGGVLLVVRAGAGGRDVGAALDRETDRGEADEGDRDGNEDARGEGAIGEGKDRLLERCERGAG